MDLYRNEASNPLANAQRNLMGRTHYVDPDTLRFHKSKVLSSGTTDNGLLFYVVTSDALDMNNTKRGCRYVIFDLFGHVLARTSIENAYRRSEQAKKAMWAELNLIDAKAVTLLAIEREANAHIRELADLTKTVQALGLVVAS